MKNGDPATKYLGIKEYRVISAKDPMHPVLFLDNVKDYLNVRPVCLSARCGCDNVPMTRLDEDRWQIVLKRPGEMHETFILCGWSGP